MITPKHISEIIAQPHLLQKYSLDQVKAWVEQFPYNSLMQHLLAIKQQDEVVLNNITQLYPVHPVLHYILKKEVEHEYSYFDVVSKEEEGNITVNMAAAEIEEEETNNAINNSDIKDSETILEELDLPIESPVQDYFAPEEVDDSLPEDVQQFLNHNQHVDENEDDQDADKSLMRVMSFSEWLAFLAQKNSKDKAEEESKKNLKLMWQKEKLSKAIEEETEEIPEQVFNMAVNSITAPEDLHNESMAEVYVRQGKYSKAIEIYQKLSLLQPEKNIYFASKIEKLKKEL